MLLQRRKESYRKKRVSQQKEMACFRVSLYLRTDSMYFCIVRRIFVLLMLPLTKTNYTSAIEYKLKHSFAEFVHSMFNCVCHSVSRLFHVKIIVRMIAVKNGAAKCKIANRFAHLLSV